jgi:hypothetical protein
LTHRKIEKIENLEHLEKIEVFAKRFNWAQNTYNQAFSKSSTVLYLRAFATQI